MYSIRIHQKQSDYILHINFQWFSNNLFSALMEQFNKKKTEKKLLNKNVVNHIISHHKFVNRSRLTIANYWFKKKQKPTFWNCYINKKNVNKWKEKKNPSPAFFCPIIFCFEFQIDNVLCLWKYFLKKFLLNCFLARSKISL